MNVLVILEDFRRDEFLVLPIIRGMMREVGWPRARVNVCRNPPLGGVTEVLKWDNIRKILSLHSSFTDLFLLCVDRDCEEGRATRLVGIERQAVECLAGGKALLGENAWQEVEVWALAGTDKATWPKGWNWSSIRAERDPKEAYFEPYAKSLGLSDIRKGLGNEAGRRYDRVRALCPEDIQFLENRVRVWQSKREESAGDPQTAINAWIADQPERRERGWLNE